MWIVPIGVFLALLAYLIPASVRRTTVSWLADTQLQRGPLAPDLVIRAMPALDGLRAAGFQPVFEGVATFGPSEPSPLVLLVHDDGVLAELSVRTSGDFLVKLSCISVIGPRAGWMSTQSVSAIQAGDHQLKQVFPDTPLLELPARHREAIAHLSDMGLPIHPVTAESAVDDYLWAVRSMSDEHPRGVRAVMKIGAVMLGSTECGGPIATQSRTPMVVEAIRRRLADARPPGAGGALAT